MMEQAERNKFDYFKGMAGFDRSMVDEFVMIAGCGAISNEAAKNLALMGFNKVIMVDFDTIELDNLVRSIMFSEADVGKKKVYALKSSYKRINPDAQVITIDDYLENIGLGVYRRLRAVLCGLDSRAARLNLSRICYKAGVPMIDAGISPLDGYVCTYLPGERGCYECRLTRRDYDTLYRRLACAHFKSYLAGRGKLFTTSLTSSIVGSSMVMELLKLKDSFTRQGLLHNRKLVFSGAEGNFYVTKTHIKDDCPCCSEEFGITRLSESDIISSQLSSSNTLRDLLYYAKEKLGENALISMDRDFVDEVVCGKCGKRRKIMKSKASVKSAEVMCECGNTREMHPELVKYIDDDFPYLDLTLSEAGIPPLDLCCAGENYDALKYIELGGDKENFFKY